MAALPERPADPRGIEASDRILKILQAGWRRLTVKAVARGLAFGALIALLPLVIGAIDVRLRQPSLIASLACLVVATIWWITRHAVSVRSVALRIERLVPSLRNELVTAIELISNRIAAAPDISERIRNSAAQALTTVDPAKLFPILPTVALGVMAIAVWGASALLVFRGATLPAIIGFSGPPAIGIIDVRIEPPVYTKLAASSAQNPDRVDAIEGSRLRFVISSSAASVALERADADAAAGEAEKPIALTQESRGRFVADVTATRDGYLAFQPTGADGRRGVRRLLPLAVKADHAPIVTLEKPGRDLVITDVARAIPLHVSATDDIGLRNLSLKYTKVSGSGENFTFSEGELPLSIARETVTSWNADGALVPSSLHLEAGDMVVYRAVAADDRPGAPPAGMDAFVIEVRRPGEVLTEGFAMDDTPDRYKLSQQMVIVKTQQLIAKKPSITPDAFADEAVNLSAEQRKVRAEFVFMMGGELEDDLSVGDDPTVLHEDTEAMGEADLMAGRMKNLGRVDLIEAIRKMADAAATLGQPPPDAVVALKQEKDALDSLQRAFTKSRYILRTLPMRERIDETRRLTGSLAGLLPWRRDTADAPPNQRVAIIRRALDDLSALAMRSSFSPADADAVSRLAEAVLRVDPRSAFLQRASAELDRAATDLAARRAPTRLRTAMDDAAAQLEQIAAPDLQAAPPSSPTAPSSRLAGALSDIVRGGGSVRRPQ